MAEALDPEKSFKKAADHVKLLISTLEPSKLLEIYALYKQGTEGPCTKPQPRFYERQARAKWDAWMQLKDMDRAEAKRCYVELISSLDPDFDPYDPNPASGFSWVTVSSLQKSEEDLQDNDKTVFDFVKEQNLERLKAELSKNPQLLNAKDEDGLGLIHWAADRGHVLELTYLIDLKADLNLTDPDGQTALHYAASCDHFNCLQLLVTAGADLEAKDSEGLMAKDLASDIKVKALLCCKI